MPYVPPVIEMDDETKRIIGDRKLVPPPTRRKSRWGGFLLDSSEGPVSLVALLAVHKFGPFGPEMKPYWINANPYDIKMDNVGLIYWGANGKKKEHNRQHIPAVAGSPEYYREYRRKNKEKRNAYMKARYHRMKDALTKAERAEEENTSGGLADIIRSLGKEREVDSILEHEGKLSMTTVQPAHDRHEPSGSTFEPKKG